MSTTTMTTIEVDQSTAAILQALKYKAAAQGLSLDAILRPLAEGMNGAQTEEIKTPFELVHDLIGSIDSSAPDPDPSAQSRPTLIGGLVAEKLRKQGLKIP